MNYDLRLIGQVQVRGKVQKVGVFEVFEADPPVQKQAKLATKPIFEAALIHYYQGSVEKAKSLFNQCVKENPGDCVAQIYLEQCVQSNSDFK
jgi:TolA-binding protein